MKYLKTYNEVILLENFKDRFEYLRLNGRVGIDTFGYDRIFNQKFYRSSEWKKIRDYVITRDNGCDLSHSDHPISGKILVHHINPITLSDIETSSDILLDPNFLITVSHLTHEAIHYGDYSLLLKDFIERKTGDTCPWKR